MYKFIINNNAPKVFTARIRTHKSSSELWQTCMHFFLFRKLRPFRSSPCQNTSEQTCRVGALASTDLQWRLCTIILCKLSNVLNIDILIQILPKWKLYITKHDHVSSSDDCSKALRWYPDDI